jgi:diadenosine tetraphosphate (Ap4A) HIT family hydrolase
VDSGLDCPFCTLPSERIVAEDELLAVVRDAYPVSKGHTPIVPKRHVANGFDLSEAEWRAIREALVRSRAELDRLHNPDGYNIGINVGEAAGQTVFHVHVHPIPRYRGDVEMPRGGVRNVIPGAGDYR